VLRRPAAKARKLKEYQAYFEYSQRRQTGLMTGAQNVKLFFSEPLVCHQELDLWKIKILRDKDLPKGHKGFSIKILHRVENGRKDKGRQIYPG
jgi:hypothetical protein